MICMYTYTYIHIYIHFKRRSGSACNSNNSRANQTCPQVLASRMLCVCALYVCIYNICIHTCEPKFMLQRAVYQLLCMRIYSYIKWYHTYILQKSFDTLVLFVCIGLPSIRTRGHIQGTIVQQQTIRRLLLLVVYELQTYATLSETRYCTHMYKCLFVHA
jgi:ATP/ADP translocase